MLKLRIFKIFQYLGWDNIRRGRMRSKISGTSKLSRFPPPPRDRNLTRINIDEFVLKNRLLVNLDRMMSFQLTPISFNFAWGGFLTKILEVKIF